MESRESRWTTRAELSAWYPGALYNAGAMRQKLRWKYKPSGWESVEGEGINTELALRDAKWTATLLGVEMVDKVRCIGSESMA